MALKCLLFRSSFLPNLIALFLGPALVCGAQKLPTASKVWSVGPLVKAEPGTRISFARGGATFSGSQIDSQTGSVFAATRRIVFSGSRIVVAVMIKASVPQEYQLLSLDAATGDIQDSRTLENFGLRGIFPTNDGRLIVSGSTILRLTPDLREDGEVDITKSHKFARIENVSPDGSTLGIQTSPGFELLDTRTLKTTEMITQSPVTDTSVNDGGPITDNMHWVKEYPKDISFVTYLDAKGDHLLYHGRCGGRPQFLTNNLIFEPGCRKPLIIDTTGKLIKALDVSGKYSFAGSSQNGSRFALQIAHFGSLHSLEREHLAIYSTETWQPIAEVWPDEAAEEQSWTAFSPDGSLFVVGSPVKLTLYRLP